MIRRKTKQEEHKNYGQYKQDIDAKKIDSIKTTKQRKVFRYDGKIEIAINLESLANTYDHRSCYWLLKEPFFIGLVNRGIHESNIEFKEGIDYNVGQKNDNTFYIRKHIKDDFYCQAKTPTEAAKEIEKDYLQNVSREIAKECRTTAGKTVPEQYKENIPHLETSKDIKTTLLEPENITESVTEQSEQAYLRILELKQQHAHNTTNKNPQTT